MKLVYRDQDGAAWRMAGQTPRTIRLVPCDSRGYRRSGRRVKVIRLTTLLRDYRPIYT